MHADNSNTLPAPARGGAGRVLARAVVTAGLGGATAVAADPSLLGNVPAAAAAFADPPAWLVPALAGATGLAGLRLLLAFRPARKTPFAAAPAVARDRREDEDRREAPAVAGVITPDAADIEDAEAAPELPRRAVSDPSAVFPVYTSAAPAADEADEEDAATLPFPSADPAAQTGWDYDGDEREVGDRADGPATIRFEDVPSSITVGSRTIDLTEAADAGHRADALKGLTKKEKRTVRHALRDRERLLRRAA